VKLTNLSLIFLGEHQTLGYLKLCYKSKG